MPIACFQARSAGTGVKSEWILWLNSGIAAASVRNPKRSSQENTSVGAENTATISARKKHIPFTPRQAGTLTSCQNPKRRSCSWNRLCPNSGQLLQRLPRSNKKCKHWLAAVSFLRAKRPDLVCPFCIPHYLEIST